MRRSALALGFLYASLLFCAQVNPAHARAPRAVVRIATGQVSINGKPAFAGDAVTDGALLETGKGSFCVIIFDQKNTIAVSADTRVTLALAGKEKALDIAKGAVASLVRGLARISGGTAYAYTVKTPTAICGVRGTAFFVKVESPKKTYVCLCNGSLELSAASGGKVEQLTANHHKAFWVTEKGASIIISSALPDFHTDGEMESLATVIGETMDWSKPER
ncbi:MAG: FecR domain-containing protein [Thermodesulfobacteriota bacterium]